MTRLVQSIAALALAATATTARAEVLPVIVGTPLTYTPGTPFEFELRAPGVVDFASYSLELVFNTELSSTGLLTVEAFHAGTSAYAFPGTSFSATASNPNAFEHRLLISDGGPLVNTTAGVNDLLAVVRVTASAPLGALVLSVNENTLTFNINREATPEVEPPQPITINGPGVEPPPAVPAPAGVVLAGIGLAALASSRLRLRASTV